MLRKFFYSQSGATAIEYALIAGSLSIVILVAVTFLGEANGETFDAITGLF